ncbi:MAG: hypothetical protein WBQ76_00770 [Candidatus Korobacteraceae bacterium]
MLLAAGLCLAAGTSPATQTAAPSSGASATSSHPQKAHAHRKKTAPAVETLQPPPAPLTPEQMSPTPPQVTYQNGLLTIDARNSTLSQVLRAVQARTGASVEMPSSAANERVMMQVGPGRARDVLNTLLNGSKFDYVILGMADNPGGVQKVVLITRQNAAATVNTAQSNAPGHAQPQYQPPPDEPQDEEMPTEVEPDNPPQSPQGMPMPGRFRPGQVPMPQPDTNPEPVPDNGNPPNGRKTPEQLLQELQTMQQQQQNYQQQLNPANSGEQPPPEQ